MRPEQRFRQIWLATHRHLAHHPEDARFILQVDHSPYRQDLYAAVIADDEPLLVAVTAPDVAAQAAPTTGGHLGTRTLTRRPPRRHRARDRAQRRAADRDRHRLLASRQPPLTTEPAYTGTSTWRRTRHAQRPWRLGAPIRSGLFSIGMAAVHTPFAAARFGAA